MKIPDKLEDICVRLHLTQYQNITNTLESVQFTLKEIKKRFSVWKKRLIFSLQGIECSEVYTKFHISDIVGECRRVANEGIY